MNVSIDISGGVYGSAAIPDCSLIHDDGCINIQFGDVTLVFNYDQFSDFMTKANIWRGTVGSGPICDLNEDVDDSVQAPDLTGSDTDRLLWLSRHLSGHALRRIGVVYASTGLEDMRAAIDTAQLRQAERVVDGEGN